MEQQLLTVVGWCLWAALAYAVYSFWFGIFYSVLHRRPFTRITLVQAVLLTILLTFLWMTPEVSKVHIVWAAPLLYFGTLRIMIWMTVRRVMKGK